MDDEEEFSLQSNNDSLTQAPNAQDPFTYCFGNRRVHRAEDERASDGDTQQGLVENPRAKLLDIQRDVGKLGHLVPCS
jgi:hypothetical protein